MSEKPNSIPATPVPEQEEFPRFNAINLLMGGIVRALELGAEQEIRAENAERNLANAQLDALTGLHNRHALEETYTSMQHHDSNRRTDDTQRTPRAEEHSILMLDIDHFKQINDSKGHDGGDEVLKQVSGILRQSTRKRDLVVRYGGEEFAILLPRTSAENASRVAEKIRKSVEATGEATISVGLGVVDLERSLKENIKLADQALYQAKEMGRNQVVPSSEVVAQI